jgi:peptidoglycan/LPS O-acetylase OafA/YrhL
VHESRFLLTRAGIFYSLGLPAGWSSQHLIFSLVAKPETWVLEILKDWGCVLRDDIRYLRAAAVGAVVLYHLWPARVPGGYVGVDVFFVISGFLISGHLFKEATSGNNINLRQFYARRARRILPASLSVLVLSILATLIWSPLQDWGNSFRQIFASALFFQNWQLSYDKVDYLTAESSATPVQHFWTLSVEEQFYAFWPLLIVIVLAALKSFKIDARIKLGIVFSIFGLLSLAYSVVLTEQDPVQAYFSTGTRVWEFVVGALIAMLPSVQGGLKVPRIAASLLGWILIPVSVFFYTSETPFPGIAAVVPVLGTALIIWANRNEVSSNKGLNFVQKPILAIGDFSFALYLYHWPVMIFAKSAFGDLDAMQKIVVLIISALLAWVTTTYIENPIRFGALSKLKASSQLLIALVTALAVALSAGVGATILDRFSSSSGGSQTVNESSDCFGALANMPESQCDETSVVGLLPRPQFAYRDKPEVTTGSRCGASEDQTKLFSCEFGKPNSTTRVALIGDSHAMALFPAVERLAEDQGWSLTTYLRGGCPFLGEPIEGNLGQRGINCTNWNRDLNQKLAETAPFDLVLVTNNENTDGYGPEALVAAWEPIVARGSKLVVLRDVPTMSGALDCLLRNEQNPSACDVKREVALSKNRLATAAALVEGSYVVDLSDFFCDPINCHVVVGGAIVYRDGHHLTNTFASTLFKPLKLSMQKLEIIASK